MTPGLTVACASCRRDDRAFESQDVCSEMVSSWERQGDTVPDLLQPYLRSHIGWMAGSPEEHWP